MEIEVPRRFAGPPTMGHGGYVSGLLAARVDGAAQVTLRRPTPLDVPLELDDRDGGGAELRHEGQVVADSEPSVLEIDVPDPPSMDAARDAEQESPSHYDGRGVHPTCFGCGRMREPGDALRIFAGPLHAGGTDQVAGVWTPGESFTGDDGLVDGHWVLAALDCPGAFAFIASGDRAGLLGRIVFAQHAPVRGDGELLVTGWRIGGEGRKLFAGTALFDDRSNLLAAARATWFQMMPG